MRKIFAKYRIVATNEFHYEMGLLLLADAVASEVEDSESEYHEYFRDVIRPQTDIVENVRSWAEDMDIDLEKYLPIELVKKINQDHLQKTGVSIEELYDEDPAWASGAILRGLGHGVSADDDPDFSVWYKERMGKKYDWRNHQYFESPYDEAWAFLQAMKSKIKESSSEE